MDVSLYTDGEQATAAVLNRPIKEIKNAVTTIENTGIIKDTVYTRAWTGEKTAYQLSGYHKDYYYPVIFNFSTAYAQDPSDIWVGRSAVHGGHNSSWSETTLKWFCHEAYFIRNLNHYGWGQGGALQIEVDKYDVTRDKQLLGSVSQSAGTGSYGVLWIRGGIFHYIQGVKNAPKADNYRYNYDMWGDVEPDLSPLRQRITIHQTGAEQIVDIEKNMHVYTTDDKFYKSRAKQEQIDLNTEDFTTSLWVEADVGTIASRTRYELEKEVQVVNLLIDNVVKTLENTYYKSVLDRNDIDLSIENYGNTDNWTAIDAENVTTIDFEVKKVSKSVNLKELNYLKDYNGNFYKSKITEDSVDLALEDLNDTVRWEDFGTNSTSYVDIPSWNDQYQHRFYPKHYREVHGGEDATGAIHSGPMSRRINTGLNRFAPAPVKQATPARSSVVSGKYFRVGRMYNQYRADSGRISLYVSKSSYVTNMVLDPYCAAWGTGDNYMDDIPRALYKKWGSSSSTFKAFIDITNGYIYVIPECDDNKVSLLADDSLVGCNVHNANETFQVLTLSEDYMAEIRPDLREFVDIIAEKE